VSIGSSGRVVLEIDPLLKKHLYQVLGREGISMKEWFLSNANELINKQQLAFDLKTPEKNQKA